MYDVASCYPAAMIDLPSLAPDTGEWNKLSAEDMQVRRSGRIAGADRKDFDGFHVQGRWKFPKVEKLAKPPKDMTDPNSNAQRWEGDANDLHSLFSAAVSNQSGAILFPSSGASICMRDDLSRSDQMDDEIHARFPRKTR